MEWLQGRDRGIRTLTGKKCRPWERQVKFARSVPKGKLGSKAVYKILSDSFLA
jgi:hypothetical protein